MDRMARRAKKLVHEQESRKTDKRAIDRRVVKVYDEDWELVPRRELDPSWVGRDPPPRVFTWEDNMGLVKGVRDEERILGYLLEVDKFLGNLLMIQFHVFWSTLIHKPSTLLWCTSYLQNAVRWYDIDFDPSQLQSRIGNLHKSISKSVSLVLLRLTRVTSQDGHSTISIDIALKALKEVFTPSTVLDFYSLFGLLKDPPPLAEGLQDLDSWTPLWTGVLQEVEVCVQRVHTALRNVPKSRNLESDKSLLMKHMRALMRVCVGYGSLRRSVPGFPGGVCDGLLHLYEMLVNECLRVPKKGELGLGLSELEPYGVVVRRCVLRAVTAEVVPPPRMIRDAGPVFTQLMDIVNKIVKRWEDQPRSCEVFLEDRKIVGLNAAVSKWYSSGVISREKEALLRGAWSVREDEVQRVNKGVRPQSTPAMSQSKNVDDYNPDIPIPSSMMRHIELLERSKMDSGRRRINITNEEGPVVETVYMLLRNAGYSPYKAYETILSGSVPSGIVAHTEGRRIEKDLPDISEELKNRIIHHANKPPSSDGEDMPPPESPKETEEVSTFGPDKLRGGRIPLIRKPMSHTVKEKRKADVANHHRKERARKKMEKANVI